MNRIVKFGNEAEREAFANRLRADQLDIIPLYHPAQSRPRAVVNELTAEQAAWVRQSVSGLGRVFEDVQFEPMPPNEMIHCWQPEGEKQDIRLASLGRST